MTPLEHAVLAQVERLSSDIVAFTQDLVRVPTVNPPGDCYAACAELIGRRLRELAYDVEVVAAEGLPEHTPTHPRLNVIGVLGSDGPALHFNGHYDVVPPGAGWSVEPFSAELRGGRIYGRGACDQKAGIAASIYAVEAVRRAGIPVRVEQSATADEESGGFAGVAWLCDAGIIARDRQRYVLITEPLDPERVCLGHRGVYWFQVTTLGRVGHGSMPGLAMNLGSTPSASRIASAAALASSPLASPSSGSTRIKSFNSWCSPCSWRSCAISERTSSKTSSWMKRRSKTAVHRSGTAGVCQPPTGWPA